MIQAKIQTMQRYVRIKIYALSLEQEKTLSQSQINPLTFLNIFPACTTEINSLLEYIVNAPLTEYKNFSITNWAPVIQSVVTFPKLGQFSILDVGVANMWKAMIEAERATYLTNLERLCDRLEGTSITKRRANRDTPSSHNLQVPDLFYLFCTVLRLFKSNLVRESQPLLTDQIPTNNHEQSNKRARSRCPVINGDLQNTDYWTMWMNSNNLMSDVELFGDQAVEFPEFDVNDPTVFDLNSWVDFSV